MADFEIALQKTLKNEGAFYHDEKTGEISMRGISIQFLHDNDLLPLPLANGPIRAVPIQSGPNAGKYTLSPYGKIVTKAERDRALAPAISYMQTLTESAAASIYHQFFWTPMLGDQIVPQLLADKLFDLRVNIGPGTANRLLQEAVNESKKILVAVDGVIGLKTVEAMNDLEEVEPGILLARFRVLVEEHYKAVYDAMESEGEAGPELLEGWLARLAKD